MNRLFNGKQLVFLLSIPVLAITGFLIFQNSELILGLRSGIRFTAQYSLVLFSITFMASSLLAFSKNSFTKWVRKNRRYLGLSFAVSHLVHGITILALYLMFEDVFQQTVSPLSKIFGGIGFFVIFVLAVTSSDSAIKKIGTKRWSDIHSFGMYYIWFIFLASYLPRALKNPEYWPLVLFIVACLGLRIVHSRSKTALINS